MKRMLSLAAVIGAAWIFAAAALGAEQYRAVSLKVLQERLRICVPAADCDDDVLTLCSLTQIDGYIIDEKNNDLILYGSVEPERPPLYTENLVVALRNKWNKYAKVVGNTIYYSDPACSIDPDSQTIQTLIALGEELSQAENEEAVAEVLKRWDTACVAPEAVSVFGVPFDSRFAGIMVQADYDMKRLASGIDSLPVEGFRSVSQVVLDEVREDLKNQRSPRLPGMMMNRFWFAPGENTYLADDSTVRLDRCDIVLLTEAEYFRQGTLDPYAKQFAESFTRLYREVAAARPIYFELESLFRFVALAAIMETNRVSTTIDLNYLLDEYPLPKTIVNPTLVGLPHQEHMEHRRDYDGGYEVFQSWLPMCGGVGIRIPTVTRLPFPKPRPDLKLRPPRFKLPMETLCRDIEM
jgi:hypothetical protein